MITPFDASGQTIPKAENPNRHRSVCIGRNAEASCFYLHISANLRTHGFPGKYETGVDIKQGEWFHAKFVIKGKSLKVFVNGSDNPILTVDPMLDGVSKGSVGVWGWDSYFANFKYTPD